MDTQGDRELRKSTYRRAAFFTCVILLVLIALTGCDDRRGARPAGVDCPAVEAAPAIVAPTGMPADEDAGGLDTVETLLIIGSFLF